MIYHTKKYRLNGKLLLVILFLFLVSAVCFGKGNAQSNGKSISGAGYTPEISVFAEEPPLPASAEARSAVLMQPTPAVTPARSEQVMKALAEAYPDRVGPAEFRKSSPQDDGDWAVSVRGTWYYYTGGRLLPEELRDKAEDYDPQPFYNYSADLPPWKDPAPEDAARFREQNEQRKNHPAKRSQHFLDALWRASSRDESWDRVKSIHFLGHPVLVHYSILEELALVEEQILAEAKINPQVKQWINSLNTLDGWNWRSIADTQSRSYHAYGAALDLLPKNLGGLETYWLWAGRKKSDWWSVPYNKRFHPPLPVIKAFESYGFVWGGKWLFFDTMHFEYRPEIFMLNKLPLSDLR